MKNLIKQSYFKIFIICIISVLNSMDTSAQWTSLNSGTTSYLYSINFPSVNSGYACGINGIILRTATGGNAWANGTPFTISYLFSICFTDNLTGYTCGSAGSILKTTTNGLIWNTMVSGTAQNLRSVYFLNSNTGYAAGDGQVILKTTNAGVSWNPTVVDALGTEDYYSVYFTNNNVGWVCGWETIARIRKTTDAGATWLSQGSSLANHILRSIKFYNATEGVAVGDGGYILRTTNGGTNWIEVSSGITNDLQSVDVGTNPGLLFHNWFAVGYGGKILKSTNNGANWFQLTSGTVLNLAEIDCTSLDTAFVVGGQGTILRTYNAGGPPTEIHNSGNSVPKTFQLMQNYPNPFNPSTIIEFGIPEQANVSLKIYDLTGREVNELVNGSLSAGSYYVDFKPENLSSGIYFYRLNVRQDGSSTVGFTETKIMSLIK